MTSTRILGPITILLALLTTWAVYGRGWMAGPLALCFVVLAFWWHLQRPAPRAVMVRSGHPAGRGDCTGCRTGCARCRERIDPPVA